MAFWHVALWALLFSGCNGGHCDGRQCDYPYVTPSSGDVEILWDERSYANIQVEGDSFDVPLSGEAIVRFVDDDCVPSEEAPCLVDVKSVSLTLDEFEVEAEGRHVSYDGMAIDSLPGRLDDAGGGVWWFDETYTCAWGPGPGRDADASVLRSWTLEFSREEESARLATSLEVELPLDDRCGSTLARISISATSRGLWRKER